jgi:hypothetical protein
MIEIKNQRQRDMKYSQKIRVTGALSSGLFDQIKNIVPANNLVRRPYHTDEQAHDGSSFDNT